MVCYYHVWDSIFRHQLENGLHKIPATPPRLESDRVNIHLCVLFRADLQPIQRLLLGHLPALMRPGEHCFCFPGRGPNRTDAPKQEEHAFENPRRLYWWDYTDGYLGIFRFRISRSVLVPLLFSKTAVVDSL